MDQYRYTYLYSTTHTEHTVVGNLRGQSLDRLLNNIGLFYNQVIGAVLY